MSVPHMKQEARRRLLSGWRRDARPKRRAVKASPEDLAAVGISVETNDG